MQRLTLEVWKTLSFREKSLWAAGLWEGEGTVKANASAENPRSNGASVVIQMGDREPLVFMQDLAGGTLTGPYMRPGAKPYHRPLWTWGVYNWNAVEGFYSIIGPWLSMERRIDQWESVMALAPPPECRGRGKYQRPAVECRNGHPWTPENTIINADGRRRCRTCRDDYSFRKHLEKNAHEPVRSLGAHNQWHVNRGIVHDNCIHCGTAEWSEVPPRQWETTSTRAQALVTAVGMHNRWHVKRDITHPNCIYCGTGEGEPYKRPPMSDETRARIAEAQRNTRGWASHLRWHVYRDIVGENCVHCGTADVEGV